LTKCKVFFRTQSHHYYSFMRYGQNREPADITSITSITSIPYREWIGMEGCCVMKHQVAWTIVIHCSMACLGALSGKFSSSRIRSSNSHWNKGNISCQFCVSCTGSLSRDVSTSNWHALSSRRCPARHLHTWPTTYTWSQKVLDTGSDELLGSAHPPTDRTPFYALATHLATGALLLPGHMFGTASQHTCATRTLLTTVSDVNLRRTGFNVASGAQCDILLNCAI